MNIGICKHINLKDNLPMEENSIIKGLLPILMNILLKKIVNSKPSV